MPGSVFTTDLIREKGPFFRVLHTTKRSQTAFMTVPPGEEAGPPEVHDDADQVFYVVEGVMRWKAWSKGEEAEPEAGEAGPGTVLVVPAGIRHHVASVGKEPLLFLTVYAPPEY